MPDNFKPLDPNNLSIAPKESICEEALRITEGDRRNSYGDSTISAKRIAKAWTAYLLPKLKEGEELDAEDPMLMMVIFKTLRESHQKKRDNRVDIIGYAIQADKVV